MKDTKKIKKILIIVLTITLITSSFITYKTYQNKQHLIEENKKNSKSNQTNKKQFAIFLKNPDNNQYESYNGSDFPEGYIANLDKSNCADINGSIIKDVISNSDNGITVTSNKTVYCEIYLEKKPITGSSIVEEPISGVIEPTGAAQDELATRYYGTNPPNYICFGTTNKSTCTGDQDKYMYRIIGVDKSGRYKVIKKEALNTKYAWYSNYTSDIKWPDSTIYSQINGSAFLTNSTYMPSGWSDKIESMAWKYGDIYDSNVHTTSNKTAAQMVQAEQGWTSTTPGAKIGLMYLADYYYGLSKTGLNCSYNSSQNSTCATSWMHLSQNDTSAPHSFEWTMSRYGNAGGDYFAWYVTSNGFVGLNGLTGTHSVRPVFYLKSNITINGTGTQTDPYLITN